MSFAARRNLRGSDSGAVLGSPSACGHWADRVLDYRSLGHGTQRHAPVSCGPQRHGAVGYGPQRYGPVGHDPFRNHAWGHDSSGNSFRGDGAFCQHTAGRHATGKPPREGDAARRRATE